MVGSTARMSAGGGLHPKLGPLEELAGNLYWAWDEPCREVFRRLDPSLWERTEHSPAKWLRLLSRKDRVRFATDSGCRRFIERRAQRVRDYLKARTWFEERYGRGKSGRAIALPTSKNRALALPALIAYFSMEYGLHESLPIYAGGLGILAGDHLKSASDLGIPLVGLGIFWKEGYTRQTIEADGTQTDRYPVLDPRDAPMTEVMGKGREPLRLRLPVGGDTVTVRGWRVQVGSVPLVLLDTDLPANKPAHRRLTHRLYSGDRDMRIRQEILLGVGGWRFLKAMGLRACVCHLNEGHAAFVSLERIAELMESRGLSYAAARKRVAATNVFTTHTPVPAGNETFEASLVEAYVGGYARRLRLTPAQFLDLGRVKPGSVKEPFGMTPLALRTSDRCNGVSALHGAVARKMWKDLYPGRPVSRVPIGSVTNGVHLRTWLHPRMAELLEACLGPEWDQRQDHAKLWKGVETIPDGLLWRMHEELTARLVSFVRCKLMTPEEKRRDYRAWPRGLGSVLNLGLTIGFARRFASYKRAALIFDDPKRLDRLVNDPDRPVQFIFAGKAHPADTEGKAVLKRVARFAAEPRFRRRIVLIEDYEMNVARHMVAGVDVWLNNPRRPQEASGTSGMKPALHGGLNLSILDGWWPEAYDGRNGWAIGSGKDHDGSRAADVRDAKELYRVLERQIVPLYYERDDYGLPRAWIARMKHAIATIPPVFNSHRQVKEYFKKYYLPALRAAHRGTKKERE